jgi:hypothetical protein
MAASDTQRRTLNLSEIYPGLMLPVRVLRLSGRNKGIAIVDPENHDAVSLHTWAVHAPGGTRARGLYVCAHVPGDARGAIMHLAHLITGWPRTGHINADPFDCRRVNLTRVDGGKYRAAQPPRAGKSRFKGVIGLPDGRWRVRPQIRGERRDAGVFTDEAEAARAYDKVLADEYGAYAMTNARLGLLPQPAPPPLLPSQLPGLRLAAVVEALIRCELLQPGEHIPDIGQLAAQYDVPDQDRAPAVQDLLTRGVLEAAGDGYVCRATGDGHTTEPGCAGGELPGAVTPPVPADLIAVVGTRLREIAATIRPGRQLPPGIVLIGEFSPPATRRAAASAVAEVKRMLALEGVIENRRGMWRIPVVLPAPADDASGDSLLTPGEAAGMAAVTPPTIGNWEKAGLLTSVCTEDGARRYRETELRALLAPRQTGRAIHLSPSEARSGPQGQR